MEKALKVCIPEATKHQTVVPEAHTLDSDSTEKPNTESENSCYSVAADLQTEDTHKTLDSDSTEQPNTEPEKSSYFFLPFLAGVLLAAFFRYLF